MLQVVQTVILTFEFMLKGLEGGRQESLPTILCEPDSFGGRSEPLKSVVIRECPHDSLGLLSPLRCFVNYAATLIHRIFRIRSFRSGPWLFF